jgi:5-methylcytosine-specific restriction endonuclease McrA
LARLMTKVAGETYHVDHVIPIAKGGLHVFSNLRIITARENVRKGASLC